ncbi:MAG: TIM barrel protein [bacterium]|nr:TIM barrel protein [bacterium]
MLKFSANLSMLFTDRPLMERFAAAHAAGFSAVEIQFPYELDIPRLEKQLQDNALELVLINAGAGDLMSGGDGLACVPGKEAEFRAAVTTALEYAVPLNIPAINILSGRQPAGTSRESCMAVLLENLHYATAACKAAGVKTLVEAINIFDMPRFLVHSLHDLNFLCDQVNGVQMQFDCYHVSRMGEDVLMALRNHLAQTGHIQFADNPGRHEPGSGHIEYEQIFSFLQTSAYAGWCGAEYRPATSTENSLAWLRSWQEPAHKLP